MKKLRAYIILLLALCNISIRAEEQYGDYATRKYSVIPPSPEVASLMKYIDVPVSHFTGQPQIEIPIYTITEGSLSVPISLSYRGGGVKQNELPGIISKGWTLMAGMTISRTVHGLPDECNHNSGTTKHLRGLFYLNSTDSELRTKLINRVSASSPHTLSTNIVIPYTKCVDYENGYVDFANDIFKFYGQGLSGTFIYDTNRSMTLSTGSPIKFTNKNIYISGTFIMEDKDKTIYTFEDSGVEETSSLINAALYNTGELKTDSLKYRSAWHITKMESLYGDVINFEYSNPIYRSDYMGLAQYYDYFNGGAWCHLTDRTGTNSITSQYHERSLLAIKTKSTSVRFHYDSAMKQLTAISIHKNDSQTTELWRYSISRDEDGNMTQINQTSGAKTQVLYGFGYASKSCTATMAFDHWGYCNGATSNTTILPSVSGLEHLSYTKATRTPSESFTKQGILTSIKYPMGGTTTLNWEQNDYSYNAKNSSYLQPTTQTITSTETVKLRGTQINQRLNSGTYTISSGDYVLIDLSTYLEPIMNSASAFQLGFQSEYEDTSHAEPYPRLDIYKDGAIYQKYYIDKANSVSLKTFQATGTYQFALVNPRSFTGVSETNINNFWGYTPTTGYENYGYITITIKTTSTKTENAVNSWGGLRIAGITSNPENGTSITKNYSYTTTVSNKTTSSGVIYDLPNYEYQSVAYYTAAGGYGFANIYSVSSNGIPASTDGEIGIEYSEVWESYSDGIKGEIGYVFNTRKDFNDEENCLFGAYVPNGLKTLTGYGFKRGLLKEKLYRGAFEETDWDNIIYKRELYDYDIQEGTCNTYFSGPLHTICDYSGIAYSNGAGDILDKHYTINKYKLIPYNKRIKTETILEKDTLNAVNYSHEVIYSYYGEADGYNENPWNSFVKSKSYVNSKGETVTTYYTYYKIGNIPIDQTEYEITVINGTIVSARRMEYDAVNNRLKRTYTGAVGSNLPSNFSLPTHATGTANGLPSLNNLEYSYEYDSNGNIVQISYNGKVLASYLWGYLGKHPIVEVQGMTYSELFSIASSYGYTDGFYLSNMQQFLTSLRADSRLTGKEVLAYTYHWLLGMATSTDSRGIKNTYLLDGFGRLSGVKDNNGYYISKYDYNYKGF